MNRKLLLIAVVAFGVRLAAVVPLHVSGQTSDERDYVMLAGRLASGASFVDADGEYSKRYPLFPILLGAVLRVAGDSLWPLYVLNAILGALAVVLVSVLAKAVWSNEAVAAAAAWAAALYPGLVVYGAVLQTESLYVVLMLLAILHAVRLGEGAALREAVGLGLAGGLAALTRAPFLAFFPFLLLLVIVLRARGRGRFREPAVALMVFLLVLAPWTWRNFRVHGALVPVSTVSGQLFLIGNNPYATGTWSTRPGFGAWYAAEAEKRGTSDPAAPAEVERSRLAARIGLDYVLGHPAETARLLPVKAHIFWVYPITNTDSSTPLQGVAVLADAMLYLAAVLGLVRMKGAGSRLAPVYGAIIFFFLLSMVLHAEARYRLPLMPLFCMFGAWSALPAVDGAAWKDLLRDRRRALWAAAGVLLIIGTYGWTGWLFLSGAYSH